MVVDDQDIVGVSIFPAEADTPLLVDSNAILPGSFACQLLQTIARWDSEVVQLFCCVNHYKFSQHYAPQSRWKRSHRLSLEQTRGPLVSEALYHLR